MYRLIGQLLGFTHIATQTYALHISEVSYGVKPGNNNLRTEGLSLLSQRITHDFCPLIVSGVYKTLYTAKLSDSSNACRSFQLQHGLQIKLIQYIVKLHLCNVFTH